MEPVYEVRDARGLESRLPSKKVAQVQTGHSESSRVFKLVFVLSADPREWVQMRKLLIGACFFPKRFPLSERFHPSFGRLGGKGECVKPALDCMITPDCQGCFRSKKGKVIAPVLGHSHSGFQTAVGSLGRQLLFLGLNPRRLSAVAA